MRKLRIAILASNLFPLPPDPTRLPPGFAGASERIMSKITDGLVAHGHDVKLYASGDSKTTGRLISVSEVASIHDQEIGLANHFEMEHLLIRRCYLDARDQIFDIIHSSFDTRSAYYSSFVSTPTVATLHSPLVGIKKRILEKIPDTQWYVSISNAQRKNLPNLRYAGTVYHGVDPKLYPAGDGAGGFLLIVGRITPDKGILQAAQLAHATGMPLQIFGTHHQGHGDAYWVQIVPYLGGNLVQHGGMLSQNDLFFRYGQAKAYLFPLQWEEPFGLVMIEAMACGTPVIAFARGSVPEIVVDGVTGYILNPSVEDIRGDWVVKRTGMEGMKEAIRRIYEMPNSQYRAMRLACRKRIEDYFTIEKMVAGYERVYEQILGLKTSL